MFRIDHCGSYRLHALICTADVWQCTTTGFVFTANARVIPSATSDLSRIVIPSAPNERPHAAKSGLVSFIDSWNGRPG